MFGGGYHDEITHKQKAKHVICLVKPNTIHNKIQFHENRAEREDPAQQRRREGPEVDALFGDLAWDLVCSDGGIERIPTEPEEGACDGQRDRNQEPD